MHKHVRTFIMKSQSLYEQHSSEFICKNYLKFSSSILSELQFQKKEENKVLGPMGGLGRCRRTPREYFMSHQDRCIRQSWPIINFSERFCNRLPANGPVM